MIIDMDGFEIDLDQLFNAFGQLFQNMDIDGTDEQQIYNTVTVFIASLMASGLHREYGNDQAELELQIQTTCNVFAEDLEEKIKAFLK